jgi:hypothetical protein
LSSLENKPPVPKRKREPEYSWELVNAVKSIRKADPSYSAKKIRLLLLWGMEAAEVPSVATTGRLIAWENLFFRSRHQTA